MKKKFGTNVMRHVEGDGLQEQHERHPLVVGVVQGLVRLHHGPHAGVRQEPALQETLVVMPDLDGTKGDQSIFFLKLLTNKNKNCNEYCCIRVNVLWKTSSLFDSSRTRIATVTGPASKRKPTAAQLFCIEDAWMASTTRRRQKTI
ncbi:hypothetical protein SFRURICE_004909 [Spodoptera frugiperda]|nr:hypothetical protein SFRURICE_004909 [Spodoptera frugiperda]